MDEEELANFSRLAASWWDETGEFIALHSMNKLRIPFIRDALMNKREDGSAPRSLPLDGLKIVDTGSGGGLLAEVGYRKTPKRSDTRISCCNHPKS